MSRNLLCLAIAATLTLGCGEESEGSVDAGVQSKSARTLSRTSKAKSTFFRTRT
jgi:hypothetical protein